MANGCDFLLRTDHGRRRTDSLVVGGLRHVRIDHVVGVLHARLHQQASELQRAFDAANGHGLLRLGKNADVLDGERDALQFLGRRRNQRLTRQQPHPARRALLDHDRENLIHQRVKQLVVVALDHRAQHQHLLFLALGDLVGGHRAFALADQQEQVFEERLGDGLLTVRNLSRHDLQRDRTRLVDRPSHC
ncbi:hypothetical protein D9M71_683970 [compost metagenome]